MIRCNFLQSFKKFCEGGSESPLIFENLRCSLIVNTKDGNRIKDVQFRDSLIIKLGFVYNEVKTCVSNNFQRFVYGSEKTNLSFVCFREKKGIMLYTFARKTKVVKLQTLA